MASNISLSTAGKWLGFVSAIWLHAIFGNSNTFPTYSAALKTVISLTQLQLNNLSVAKDVGKALDIFHAIASDFLLSYLGLLIGSIVGMVGYDVQWLVVSRRIQLLPYWAMFIFLCLGSNGCTWMNTAVLVKCIHNFGGENDDPIFGILESLCVIEHDDSHRFLFGAVCRRSCYISPHASESHWLSVLNNLNLVLSSS